MTRSNVAPLIALAAIVAVSILASSNGRGVDETGAAEDHWARALYLSTPVADSSTDAAAKQFSAALSLARNKAPILVAYGDAMSGFMAFYGGFEETAAKAEQAFDDREFDEDELADIVASITDPWDAGRSEARRCYRLATIIDPNFLPAWFRLASQPDSENRESAIDGFSTRDPRNALPHYLRAALLIEKGQMELAVAQVETGNRKPVCRAYSSPIPKRFRLRFPVTREFQRLGVADRFVPRKTLRLLVQGTEDCFAWADDVTKELRSVRRALSEEATRQRLSGNERAAIRFLEAEWTMGLRLLCVVPHGDYRWLAAIPSFGRAQLELLYRAKGRSTDLRRLQQQRQSVRRFLDQVLASKSIDPESFMTSICEPPEDWTDHEVLSAVLRGERDLVAERENRHRRLLQSAGLVGSGRQIGKQAVRAQPMMKH